MALNLRCNIFRMLALLKYYTVPRFRVGEDLMKYGKRFQGFFNQLWEFEFEFKMELKNGNDILSQHEIVPYIIMPSFRIRGESKIT